MNLFFRVLRKREDGYHEVASLYQAIDLFDRLFFSWADTDGLTCSDPRVPCGASNLVMKALALFRSYYPVPPIHVHLEKNIPIQAGLGGGSSNAATALWGLNEWVGRPFEQAQLAKMGAQIGSDVPFFFSSGTAYCTGRGEIATPFAIPTPLRGFVAKPSYGLETALVYQNLRVGDLPERDPLLSLSEYPRFFNDLESASFRLEPRLLRLRDQLKNHFETVVMTGSGSSLFCLNGDPPAIEGVCFVPFHSTVRSDPFCWY